MDKVDKLEIYKAAGDLADSIWRVCSKWEHFAKMTMGKQICRAADSVPANIAEAVGRFHFKETLRFLYIARGSLEETRNWLLRAKNRQFIAPDVFSDLERAALTLIKRLNALIGAIKPLARRSPKPR